MKRCSQAGFTLTEIFIVIAIIGVLVSLVALSYSSWRTSTLETTMKSDLLSLAAAMDDARNFHDKYPATLPADFRPSGSNVVELVGVTDTYYCADIDNPDMPNVTLSYDSEEKSLHDYSCSDM